MLRGDGDRDRTSGKISGRLKSIMYKFVLSIGRIVATISVHQRLLFTMDNSRCGRNDFCPLAKWTIVVEHVDRALRKMLITVKTVL